MIIFVIAYNTKSAPFSGAIFFSAPLPAQLMNKSDLSSDFLLVPDAQPAGPELLGIDSGCLCVDDSASAGTRVHLMLGSEFE